MKHDNNEHSSSATHDAHSITSDNLPEEGGSAELSKTDVRSLKEVAAVWTKIALTFPSITSDLYKFDSQTARGIKMETVKTRMAALKTICKMYDWKYDTIYKKFKRGEFVPGYRDPAGRGVRFDLDAVDRWAHQNPLKIIRASLIVGEL